MDNVLEVSELQATIPDILTGVVQMISFPFIQKELKKYGVKKTYIWDMMFAVIRHAALTLKTGYYFAATTYIVILLGYGFASALLLVWGGLLTDHIELNTGKRQPALIGGLMAIFMIPAASFHSLILSMLLEVTNYNGSVKHQTLCIRLSKYEHLLSYLVLPLFIYIDMNSKKFLSFNIYLKLNSHIKTIS